jgi:hypothetical protein
VLVATVGVHEDDRLLDEAVDTGPQRRVHEVAGALAADPVVDLPRRPVPRLVARRDRRGQVDDDVVAGDGGGEGLPIEQAHLHGLGAEAVQLGRRRRRAGDAGDLGSGGQQLGHRPAAHDPRRPAHEDPHVALLSLDLPP